MKYHQLSREQRYAIYLGLNERKTKTDIARQIGCNVSTVCREIKRNSNRHGRYVFNQAVELAQVRRERSTANRKTPRWVLAEARRLLVENDWSPQQISGYLKRMGVCVSHERIYRMVREDETGELRKHTRHGMKYRHHVKRVKTTKATNIPGRVSIHERPEEADGARFGDWELDLVLGKGQKSALVTITERSTNFLLIGFVPDKRPETVARKVWSMLVPFKGNALKTITTDNGSEFRDHGEITRKLAAPVYFTDAYSSWQKGSIENANKLIRQYFPKGTDFNKVTAAEIMAVQKKINARPRIKLNFESPKTVFFRNCG